ncbi:MAG: tetratricopeptide (TPR) repeat protein [Planctomycetaceae bacterium]
MTQSRESSTSCFASANDPATTLLNCARQLEETGLMVAARNAYQAAALADDTPNGRVELAGFQFRTEFFDEASKEYESLLGLAAETDNRRLAEVARHNLAAVLRKTGQTSRATTLQARASETALSARGELGTADLTGRALDAIDQEDFDLAENLLLRSLAVEKETDNRTGEATDCANLGALALLRGDNAVGIRFLARAYHLHRTLNDQVNAGTDLLNLAEAFQNASRWSLASRCLRRAISQFESCGAERSLNTARTRLREVQQVQSVFQRDPLLN